MNRLHPLSAVTMALQRGILGLTVVILGASVLTGVLEFTNISWALVLGPIGFILGAAYGVAYYYRFEYELTEDTFDLASGVISRRSREIPFRRIQNVDVRQGIIYQLLGISLVNVETAGGGDTEAQLNFVSESEADRLQREIRRLTAQANARQTDPSAQSAETVEDDEKIDSETAAADFEPDETDLEDSTDRTASLAERPKTLFELVARELLLYSFTSFRIAAGAAVLFLLFFAQETVQDVLLATAAPFGGPDDFETVTTQQYGILTLVSLIHGAVLTYVFSVIYTFLGYYDFTLGNAGEDLVYERGLLQRYSGSIPVEKIQSITVTDNPVQRFIGYAGLWIETAGYGPNSSGGSQSAVPLAQKRRAYWFAERLTGIEKPSFVRPTTVARRRYVGRYSIIAGILVGFAFVLSLVTGLENWWLTGIVFLAVPIGAHLRWINIGYYVGEDHIVIRSGFWRRRTTVIPYYRLQTVSTRRSIFQRRLGLASLVVDTASSRTLFWSTPTIYDLELETARTVHKTTRDRLQISLAKRAESADDAGLSVDFT